MKELEYTTNYCGVNIYTLDQLNELMEALEGFSLSYCVDELIENHYDYKITHSSGRNSYITTQGLIDKKLTLADFIIEFKSEIDGDL